MRTLELAGFILLVLAPLTYLLLRTLLLSPVQKELFLKSKYGFTSEEEEVLLQKSKRLRKITHIVSFGILGTGFLLLLIDFITVSK